MVIEHLFYGQVENFYFENKTVPGEGNIIRFKGNKKDFSLKCKDFDTKAFQNFKPLFEKIKEILTPQN